VLLAKVAVISVVAMPAQS